MASNIKKVTTIEIDTSKSVKAVDDLTEGVKDLDTSLEGASQSVKEFGDNSGQSVDKVEMMVDKMTNVTKVSAGLVGGFEAVEGTMALFGVESDKVAEALVRMQGLMNLSNGLQSIAEGFEGFKNLRKGAKDAAKEMSGVKDAAKNSTKDIKNIGKEGKTSMTSLSTGADKASKGLTKAGKAGKKSMSGLKKAIIGTGIGALVVIIGSIITNWEEFTKAIGISEGAIMKVKATFNGVMAVISNGMQHLSSAVGKLIKGDFSGAWDEFKSIVTTADEAFAEAVTETHEKAAEEVAQHEATEAGKAQKRYIELQEAKLGEDWKYTKEGKRAYDNYYNHLLKAYGKDTDEYHSALVEKLKYDKEYKEKKDELDAAAAKEKADKEKADRENQMTSIPLKIEPIKVTAKTQKDILADAGKSMNATAKKLNDQAIKDTKAAEDKKAALRAGGIQAAMQAMQGVSDILNAVAEQDGISAKKKKRLQISATVINTLMGAANAFMSAQTLPPPVSWIAGGIGAATALTMGLLQINKMKNTPLDGETEASVDSAAPAVDPGALAAVNQSNEIKGAEISTASIEKNIKDTRVYVSETDIKNTGKKVNVAESESTF